jgi:acyl dehydratase
MTEGTAIAAASPPRDWKVGDKLAEVIHGPLTRADFALFAGASGDHVPLHIDSDYAKAAGFDDVFAHGMLSMAYLAQVLTGGFPPETIRELSTRFLSITPLHATVHCSGEIVEVLEAQSERLARVDLRAHADGSLTLQGSALVALG